MGVYQVRPGITGLAQINNINMSTPELLAKIDSEMIQGMSFLAYFKYILKTVMGSGSGDAI
jgi:lipopolysaccharide/colanic/teichoic acid biosynthesis glycosyltransferase